MQYATCKKELGQYYQCNLILPQLCHTTLRRR